MLISMEMFFLDPGFAGTLQQQIRQLISRAILSGRFRPGDKMPSSRKLAKHLGVSRITVTLAYNELLSDDYLTAKGRSGYFISPTAPQRSTFKPAVRIDEETVDWNRAIGRRYSGTRLSEKPVDWSAYPYPFIYGQADKTLFDHQNWRLCAISALGRKDFETLTADFYERDDPKLVGYIADQIAPRRGILARPEQIMLTMGAQNALWLTAQVLLTQRRTAVMERPGYHGLRTILNQTRCNVVSIDVDEKGLPPHSIPPRVDVVFTTPSHHCPTNATLPMERRLELLARAAKDDFLVVEDDYEFEMSFLKPPLPALKSLDRDGRVIHIGSFSKSLFPGLRLGYVIGPETFIREVRALRATVLRHPPGHIQTTVANFLSLGHYDALVQRMAQAYQKRRVVMDLAIRQHGLTIAGSSSTGGSSFWMRAPDHVDTGVLAGQLQARGVLIEPGRVFFDEEGMRHNFYRLAYSSISPNQIPEGIRLIAEAIENWI